MATPKGHKPACKCVACSPATRKRGQAELKKRRAAGEGTANKPSKARKNGAEPAKPRTQRTAENTTVVVNMPATPAAAKKPRKAKRRTNPAAKPAASAEPRARNIGLPSLEAGRFIVIVAREGKGVSSIKGFPTKKAALEYAAGVTGGRVRVCEVSHAAG